MLSSKRYYSYLNERFLKKNVKLFPVGIIKRVRNQFPENEFEDVLKLLDIVEEKYEFNMQNAFKIIFDRYATWQYYLFGELRLSSLAIAVKFNIFCCLADKILDSKRFNNEEKELVCAKFDINHFTSCEIYESDNFIELDILLNDVRKFLTSKTIIEHYGKMRELIFNKLQSSAISEIYMYKSPLVANEAFIKSDLPLLIDKTTDYVEMLYLIASISVDVPNVDANSEISNDFSNATLFMSSATEYEEKLSKNYDKVQSLAKIIWLIDDLCDFIEDVKNLQKNSLLYYCVDFETELPLQERVNLSFQNIDKAINELERNISYIEQNSMLFNNIMQDTWEWFSDVRKLSE